MDRDKRLQEIIDNRMIYYFGGLDIEISEKQKEYVEREAEEIYNNEKAIIDMEEALNEIKNIIGEPLIKAWERVAETCKRIRNKKEG